MSENDVATDDDNGNDNDNGIVMLTPDLQEGSHI